MMAIYGCNNPSDKSATNLRFGFVADVQYAEKPVAMGRYYAQSLPMLQQCVEDFNRTGPEFVIQLGDFIDGGDNAADELQSVVDVYDTLTMPHYHVFGNHDFNGLDRDTAMGMLGLKQSWYAFDIRDWRFLVLDTQDRAIEGGWRQDSEQYKESVTMLNEVQAAGKRNAQSYNGGFSDEQLQWLDAQLNDADAQNKSVILFGHLPLMPQRETHTAWNAEEAVAVIEKHDCVRAYFCGHRHGGGYTVHNNIHYLTFEAMVDAANAQGAWATVQLLPDQIIIEGAGAVSDRVLTFPLNTTNE
jgi:manganese-dependent ADP-ribose/CDP-alcohol diphosphatase